MKLQHNYCVTSKQIPTKFIFLCTTQKHHLLFFSFYVCHICVMRVRIIQVLKCPDCTRLHFGNPNLCICGKKQNPCPPWYHLCRETMRAEQHLPVSPASTVLLYPWHWLLCSVSHQPFPGQSCVCCSLNIPVTHPCQQHSLCRQAPLLSDEHSQPCSAQQEQFMAGFVPALLELS